MKIRLKPQVTRRRQRLQSFLCRFVFIISSSQTRPPLLSPLPSAKKILLEPAAWLFSCEIENVVKIASFYCFISMGYVEIESWQLSWVANQEPGTRQRKTNIGHKRNHVVFTVHLPSPSRPTSSQRINVVCRLIWLTALRPTRADPVSDFFRVIFFSWIKLGIYIFYRYGHASVWFSSNAMRMVSSVWSGYLFFPSKPIPSEPNLTKKADWLDYWRGTK